MTFLYIYERLHIPILKAGFPLTELGSTPLFGPGALCVSVAAGLIQEYCSWKIQAINSVKMLST